MLQQTVINARKRLIKARKRKEIFTRLLSRGKGFGVNEITNTTSIKRRSMNTILVVYIMADSKFKHYLRYQAPNLFSRNGQNSYVNVWFNCGKKIYFEAHNVFI